jgi:hypothetical protein
MSTISIPVLEVSVIVVADKDVTVARAALDGITATASARREPGDKPDARVGADLATARALARLGAKLERQARGAVRHAESCKADRQARAEETARIRREQQREGLLTELADDAAAAGEQHEKAEQIRAEHLQRHHPAEPGRYPECPLCSAPWNLPKKADQAGSSYALDHYTAVRDGKQP